MTAAGANARFYLALSLLGGVYIVLILAMLIADQPDEGHVFYWCRLAAYLIILAAIIDKNVRK